MLPPLGQAIDALTAGISGLLTTPGGATTPQVLVLASDPGLPGLGGFVGLHTDPRAELHARHLDAEIAVRVLADTPADLMAAEAQATDVGPEVARIKAATDLPVIVGFGINTPDKSRAIASVADGAVVGSAIVSQIAEGKSVEDIASFVKSLADGAHAA